MSEHLGDEDRPLDWDQLTPREQHGVRELARNWNSANDVGRFMVRISLTLAAIGGGIGGLVAGLTYFHSGKG